MTPADVALWVGVAIFAAAVIHHIHHDMKGGHRS